MREPVWSGTDDELDDIQREFVHVLQARVDGWPDGMDGVDVQLPLSEYFGYLLAPGDTGHGRLIAWADLPLDDRSTLATVGAYLDGDRVRGDKVHNQLFKLPDKPTRFAFDATGTPEELAHRTANWFEVLLQRPIVCYEWLRDGDVYARQWLMVDVDGRHLPMVETRHVRPDNGPPDRVVDVPRAWR